MVVALVTVGSVVLPVSRVQADPVGSLTITPASGLVDGQVISIEVTMPEGFYGVAPCLAGATSSDECGTAFNYFDADGSVPVTIPATVYARLTLDDEVVDCRPAGTCELVVLDLGAWTVAPDRPRVPLLFDPDGPLLAPPAVTVDPTIDLVDGQQVDITVSGLGLDRVVRATQCATGPSRQGCRDLGLGFADGDGLATWSAALRARIDGTGPGGGSGQQIDCRDASVTCTVTVQVFGGPEPDPVTIAFDPDGLLLPPPSVVVDPDSEIEDGEAVTVEGSGFLAFEETLVRLCPAGTAEDCDPTTEAWVRADATGAFSVEVTLYGRYDHYVGAVNCRRAPGCELRVDSMSVGDSIVVPVEFGPPPPSQGRYRDAVFDEVEVIHDVVYRTAVNSRGETVELRLDLYQPAGDTAEERPALIWFHGGFFVFGDRSEMEPYAIASARRGYVGVLVSYRLRPEANTGDLVGLIPAAEDALEDAAAAVRWLEDNAVTHRIDPDAIFAGGVSAGAVLAWGLNVVPDVPLADASVPISGLVLAEPTPGDAPIIAFHAVDDNILPYGPHEASCAAAVAVGVVCEWVGYSSGGHYIARSHFRDILNRTHAFLFEQVLEPLGYTNDPPPSVIDPTPDPNDPGPVSPPSPTPPTEQTPHQPAPPSVPAGPPTTIPPDSSDPAPGSASPSEAAPAREARALPGRPSFTG